MAIHPSPLGSITAFPSKLTLILSSLVFFPLLSYHRLSTLSFPSFVRFPHLQRPSSFSSLPLFLHYSHLYLFCTLISNPIPSHLISSHPTLSAFSTPNESASPPHPNQATGKQTLIAVIQRQPTNQIVKPPSITLLELYNHPREE
ncbi:hypothetical protein NXS19_003127 [Fusarium pseudograminearum]|nr:hypothetical protein NXS19_003127 [Fusarium pseudograminearum]